MFLSIPLSWWSPENFSLSLLLVAISLMICWFACIDFSRGITFDEESKIFPTVLNSCKLCYNLLVSVSFLQKNNNLRWGPIIKPASFHTLKMLMHVFQYLLCCTKSWINSQFVCFIKVTLYNLTPIKTNLIWCLGLWNNGVSQVCYLRSTKYFPDNLVLTSKIRHHLSQWHDKTWFGNRKKGRRCPSIWTVEAFNGNWI